jgi:hypothetical protein
MENIEEDDYNPYCEICSGCGEDGCCSALFCTMEEGLQYPNTYLRDLKEGYIFMKEFYNKIYEDLPKVLQERVDTLYDNIEV